MPRRRHAYPPRDYDDQPEGDVYTIPEFCIRHRISMSLFMRMRRAGNGPQEMHVGSRVLISKEAAAEWRYRMTLSEQQEAS